MSNDETLSITVDLVRRCWRVAREAGFVQLAYDLSDLLSAPVVERQEPVAWRAQCIHPRAGKQSGLFDKKYQAENWATHWRDACGLDSSLEPLYTSPPAPVAVVHPQLGSPPEDHMRWLLDKVVNPGDYPQSVLHDQIRSTLACLDKVKELNQ